MTPEAPFDPRPEIKKSRKTKPVLTTWEFSTKFPPLDQRPVELNHFGLSGGKDSTAMAIWAKFESGYDPASLDFTFCDTGNESPITYDYVKYLEDALQIGITTIHPHQKFFELAAAKKRFPSAKARFCTFALKIEPTVDYINAIFRANHSLRLHSGVRGAESDSRALLLDREYDGRFMCEVYRPLLNWTISQVWQMHEKYGIKPNPLYKLGMRRVGCFPCVMSRKEEIRKIAAFVPKAIDHIRQRERSSGSWHRNAGFSSFFPAKTIPKRFHSGTYTRAKDGKVFTVCTIDDVVRWAKTARGGKQHDVIAEMNDIALLAGDELPTHEDDRGMCKSTLGHCE